MTYDLGPVGAIPRGEGRTFDIDGTAVAVFRTRGEEVFALQASCPHKGGPLADGLVGGDTLVCPLHAFKFDLSTGEAVGHRCAKLTTYPVWLSTTGAILLQSV